MIRALSVFNIISCTYSYAIIANKYNAAYVYNNCIRKPCFVYKSIKYSSNQSQIATYEEIKGINVNKNKKVLIIDVREPEELRETGVIPGSINIPLRHIASAFKDMSDEAFLKMYGREKPKLDNPIIFSCRSGRRSADALAILLHLGYKNVKNYSGGWIDWEEKSK